jgi:methionine-rich copper-binding protein CopC
MSTPARACRAAVVVLLAGLALLSGSVPAWAHSRLEGSDPADGAQVAVPPASVSLRFDEVVQLEFSVMTLIGPDGKDYHTGPVRELNETITVAALPLGPAGEYQIGYRVISGDGHPVSGATSFTLTAPGPGSSAASPVSTSTDGSNPAVPNTAPPDTNGGTPIWPWALGAVLLVGGGVTLALRLGRRT